MKCLAQILFVGLLSLSISGLALAQSANNFQLQNGVTTVEVIAIGSLAGTSIQANDINTGKVGFIVATVAPNSKLLKKGRALLRGSDGKMYMPVDLDDIEAIDKNHDGTVDPRETAAARVQLFPAMFSPAQINTPSDLILNVNQSAPITQVNYNEMTGAITVKKANGQLLDGKNLDFYMYPSTLTRPQ